MASSDAVAVGLDRVVVVGTSGAGKSTLAALLAARLGGRFVEMDALFWGPGWQPKPADAFLDLVREAVAGDRWAVAGHYASARDVVWSRATDVVWLNLALGVVLRRVAARTARRMLRREVLWHGNRESLVRTLFTRDSIVWWVLSTHRARRRTFAQLRASGLHPHLRWHELATPRDVDRFVAVLPP